MSKNRRGFLIDTVSGGSGLDFPTNEFDVRGFAVRLVAGGAVDGDVIQVQVLAGESGTPPNGTWGDLAFNGTSVQLSNVNSQFVIVVEGRYRVVYSGGNTLLQVWMEEDTVGLDQRSTAMFPTANSGVGATGAAGATGATGATGAAGAPILPYTAQTGNFNVAVTSHAYKATTGTTITATLPAASTAVGSIYIIQAAGAGVVSVAKTGGDTINGAAGPIVIATGTSNLLYSNGVDGYSLV